MKIGILGGSFDPVHRGHLYVAQEVRRRMLLSAVWLLPAAQSPFKAKTMADFSHRWAWLRLAVQQISGCAVCPLEGLRGGISYTVDTLTTLCRLHPQEQFYFIMGADAFADFFAWKEPERILQMVELVVVSRTGCNPSFPELRPEWQKKVHFLSLPTPNISSTEVRRRLRCGEDCTDLLVETTEPYIQHQALYREIKHQDGR